MIKKATVTMNTSVAVAATAPEKDGEELLLHGISRSKKFISNTICITHLQYGYNIDKVMYAKIC